MLQHFNKFLNYFSSLLHLGLGIYSYVEPRHCWYKINYVFHLIFLILHLEVFYIAFYAYGFLWIISSFLGALRSFQSCGFGPFFVVVVARLTMVQTVEGAFFPLSGPLCVVACPISSQATIQNVEVILFPLSSVLIG